MKTQEEYALEIDEIVRRDVEDCQSDWFIIDKEIFMQPGRRVVRGLLQWPHGHRQQAHRRHGSGGN